MKFSGSWARKKFQNAKRKVLRLFLFFPLSSLLTQKESRYQPADPVLKTFILGFARFDESNDDEVKEEHFNGCIAL